MLNEEQHQEIIEELGIHKWGAGYFSIDTNGNVICSPKGTRSGSIALPEIVKQLKTKELSTPCIIRFPQIIKEQLNKMYASFHSAIKEYQYSGHYFGVFPFKVNQRREFIDSIVSCGYDLSWGLEVGSKTEFMAALSYTMHQKALLICNGFKDKEFIDMACLAAKLGRQVLLVVEGPDELELLIKQLSTKNDPQAPTPLIGLRIRLYSKGSGKWEKSSGETSKFGLTTLELMHTLTLIEKANLQDKLAMLHFHIGSQITAIKRFKNALREAARVYAKIVKMGFEPQYLNIGGGVGVDYDGSQTTAQSSANYSLQEFANDAVYVIGDVCKHEEVVEPHIVTESGRVIAAYHSVIVTDIREVQGGDSLQPDPHAKELTPTQDMHKYIHELSYTLKHINKQNYIEFYHDAIEYHDDLFALFNLGYLQLRERALAEQLFNTICLKALQFSSLEKHPTETFSTLQKRKVAKYLANFSIFQSIPDAWSIDQLFPILPLARHDERTSHKATIVDITCDSDGCIERFIDRKKEKSVLNLHCPSKQPYYIGFFLVGAYQESLANEHNLFGAINEVEVILNSDNNWSITKVTKGDSISDLLKCRNYNMDEMIASYKNQINVAMTKDLVSLDNTDKLLKQFKDYLDLYPYLIEKV